MTSLFKDKQEQKFEDIDFLPGSSWSVLAQPVPGGSIHRLKMKAGSVIPAHTHPSDEYVLVLRGTWKTGERVCEAGTFIKSPSGGKQGPHTALTDVELLTIRLGPMGEFHT